MDTLNFTHASFKDFENIPGKDFKATASYFGTYLDYLRERDYLNYRIETATGCGPELMLKLPGKDAFSLATSFVSNDYLGFTQHPLIKLAIIESISKYGAGAAASPAIGGHFSYHSELEKKIARFFNREEAILYNTGYTANSATFQCLLKKEDLAILDMAVHASIYEGCQLTNVKSFPHNNMEMLERVLKNTQGSYRTRMVIVDGVYSQDGDIAHLGDIVYLVRKYGAYLAVDDAHGVGVVGETGRGVVEKFDLINQVDIIMGTFSKALGSLGGFIVADREIINYLKFQSKQHLFSTTATPANMGIIRALELIDEEPQWRAKLWENIRYFKKGLLDRGYNIGPTDSAVVPLKVGDIHTTLELGKRLLKEGIYANSIMYPAVAKKDARIRFNLMATHEFRHFDRVFEALDKIENNMKIRSQS
ncbi:aminotransferase class I/II-fold pyridoxal phosphate-dependent enzyme [Anditalea andensis]|uniref:2-amino-3-ketobutyrate CoA ligase n=1 Tax=Anditalea andensis TaxID=1048983 RepID=A0A074KTX9_9BACT|nr:aminotransferase class I/II-fold pyridoxal phosphate-dependent enzyme [Anditalea andensis]KEO71705.1 2-amino-3-ketobutyrate CoA ligase [Anditalea andensis]